jgi:hypothetical protein
MVLEAESGEGPLLHHNRIESRRADGQVQKR